jgi:hypothetical protein
MADFVYIERTNLDVEAEDPPPPPPPITEPAPSEGLDFLFVHPFVKATVQDKIFGTIIGSALGDTIGLYTEFLTKDASEKLYPTRKFQLVAPATPLYEDNHRSRFRLYFIISRSNSSLLMRVITRLTMYVLDRQSATKDGLCMVYQGSCLYLLSRR